MIHNIILERVSFLGCTCFALFQIKSVKELLEEAKIISSPDAEPLYRRHLKPSDATHGRQSGRKSQQDRDKSASKVTGE